MLVGRGRELALLADHLASWRPVVVAGEAGIGKTTVLRAAAAAAAGGRRIFEGGALSTLSWMEYLPLRRAVGRPLAAADAQAVAAQALRAVRGGVLILDDLHWSDAMTMDVVLLLAGHCRLLTAVRRGDPGAGPKLDRMIAAGFAQVELGPLPQDESAELVRAQRPDLPDTSVRRLVRRAGGNPLLLEELARTGEPSASLRLLLAARLRLLDEAGRDAFGLLALAGRPLPMDTIGTPGAKSLLDADLAVAVPAGVEGGGRSGWPLSTPAESEGLALRTALLAEVAVDQLEPAERRALHARLARAMPEPGEAARHYVGAQEPDRALAAAIQAAELAERPGERASHLAVAASVATGRAADELRLRAARALDEAHDWTSVVNVLTQVTSEDADTRAWCQLLLARGAWAAGDTGALRTAFAEGLALVAGTGSEVEVRLRIEHSRLAIFVDCDLAEGVRVTRSALSLARSTGVEVPRAEYFLGTALAVADEPGGDQHLRSAITGARAARDVDTEFLAANNLISCYESTGAQEAAREVAEEMTDRARTLGLGYWESAMRATVVNLDFHAGSYVRAVSSAEELLDQPLEARTRDMLIEDLGMALIDLGRIDEAIRLVSAGRDAAAPDYRGQGQLLWVLAEAALWGGRPARALDLMDEYLDGPAGDPNLMFGRVTRAWACVETGRDPGPAVPPHPRLMLAATRPETAALRLQYLGEYAAAAEQFERAADLWAASHRRGQLRCAWAAGEARRLAGDEDGAVAQLEAAENLAAEAGAALVLARIHRSLRAAGRRRSAPRSGPRGGRGGLTDRERQVLELVGAGLTNSRIAAQLAITERTVAALVASASAKLGAANRGHAAALAARE